MSMIDNPSLVSKTTSLTWTTTAFGRLTRPERLTVSKYWAAKWASMPLHLDSTTIRFSTNTTIREKSQVLASTHSRQSRKTGRRLSVSHEARTLNIRSCLTRVKSVLKQKAWTASTTSLKLRPSSDLDHTSITKGRWLRRASTCRWRTRTSCET